MNEAIVEVSLLGRDKHLAPSTYKTLAGRQGVTVSTDVEGLFRNRVDETQVARVLQLVATTPNRRDRPIAGDLAGKFDFWFDGGAGQIITGWNEYDLTDGTCVVVGTSPILSVTIQFPNGSRVAIHQDSPTARIPWTGTTRVDPR